MWRTSAFVTIARLGGAGIAILTQLLVARTVGAEGLGGYYLALSSLALLSMFGSLGLPWIVPGMVASAEKENRSDVLHLFRLARVDAGKVSVGLAGLALIAVWLWPGLDTEWRLAMSLAAMTVPATTQMRMNGALANAKRRFTLAYVPELLLRPLFVFAVAVGLYFVAPIWAVPGLLLANLAATALLGAGQAWALRVRETGPDMPHLGAVKAEYRNHRKAALPMVAATLFLAIFADLDILIAGLFLDAHNLGIVSAALRMSVFVGFFVQAGHQIIMRDLADAQVNADKARMARVVGLANLSNLAVAGLAMIGAAVLGQRVLCLFGDDFTAAYPALLLLVFAQGMRAAAGPGVQMLAVAGRTRESAPVFMAAALVLVLANAVLIPLMGIVGAALAVTMTIGFWATVISLMASRATGVAAFGLAWPERGALAAMRG